MVARGTFRHRLSAVPWMLALSLATGCTSDGTRRDTPGEQHDGAVAGGANDAAVDANPPDANEPDGAASCALKNTKFLDFVTTHRSCGRDEDCTVVGDCSPNADFTAVRADAADEAYALMEMRCSGASDGPVYGAVCVEASCTQGAEEIGCCGCSLADDDAGAF